MKKFEVNPKEKLLKEASYSAGLESFYQHRGDLYIALAMVVIGGFFYYVSFDIDAFMALFVLTMIVLVICLIHFIGSYVIAKKEDGKEKYYITNVRVVITDQDDVVKKELVSTKIKKIELEKKIFGGSTIYINKKEDTSRKGKVKQFKSKKPVYTSDTFILNYVRNGSEIVKILESVSQ